MDLSTSRKIKNLSLAVTILNGVEVIGCIIGLALAVGLSVASETIMDSSNAMVESANSNDGVTTILGISGIFGGILGSIFALVLGFLFGVAIIYYLIPCIVGIITQKNANKQFRMTGNYFVNGFKADGVVKIIFNGAIALIATLAVLGNLKDIDAFVVFADLILCGITGLSIYQVVLCSKR